MPITLNQTLVLKLTVHESVHVDAKGKVEFRPNPEAKTYIVYDGHRDAPIGFGVKVSSTKKTYVIQRRVGKKVIRSKVGNVSDFPTIEVARDAARAKVEILTSTGQNPNAVAKARASKEITLGSAFSEYRAHLIGRPQPATQNTLAAFDKARERIKGWMDIKVRELGAREILAKFDDIAVDKRTAAEQTFRWASAAVKHVVRLEVLDAAAHSRDPMLGHNSFDILSLQKKFRTRAQLEKDYAAKGVRNPMGLTETLPKFLDALWGRRAKNRTGCDYLLLLLLWGDRKSEPAGLRWREDLSESEAATTPWVDIKAGKVFFSEVKSRRDHALPLTEAASLILQKRFELREKWSKNDRKWVFPARSKQSTYGHYSNARSLLEYIRKDAGIVKLGLHDIRRTFGRVAENLRLPDRTIKRLLGHVDSSNTGRYTELEDAHVLESLQLIESAILSRSATIKRALHDS